MEKVNFRTLLLSLLLMSTASFSQNGFNINGLVIYHDNQGMSGVSAYLHNSNGAIIDSTSTNNGGHYTFHNVLAGNYLITFSSNQPAGGVNLSDPFLLQQRLLNLCTFTTIQELASDVDGNGILDWDDYNLILNSYMNEEEPFPVGPWVFEELPVTVPTESREGFTTRGGSSGDVNGSLVPDPKNNSIFVTNPAFSLMASQSDPIDFQLSSSKNLNITGMHLVLKIPEGLSVLEVKSAISAAHISVIGNQVRVTWIDESRTGYEISDGMPLLVITTKLKPSASTQTNYTLKLCDESHFINAQGDLISGINLVLPTISMDDTKDLTVSLYPNPFKENTNLSCTLPDDGNLVISLIDQSGRLVQELVNGNCSAGKYDVKIAGVDLVPGIYHYSIMYTGNEQLMNSGTIIKSK